MFVNIFFIHFEETMQIINLNFEYSFIINNFLCLPFLQSKNFIFSIENKLMIGLYCLKNSDHHHFICENLIFLTFLENIFGDCCYLIGNMTDVYRYIFIQVYLDHQSTLHVKDRLFLEETIANVLSEVLCEVLQRN